MAAPKLVRARAGVLTLLSKILWLRWPAKPRSPRPVTGCICLLVFMLGTETAQAIPVTYTDSAAFEAALPGAAVILDFDSLSAGTVVADGDSVGGITFHYDFGGVLMQVSNAFDTNSPDNFLGTDDGDVFLDGDDFSLSFDPVNAIGLFFITADEMFDADITLRTGATVAELSVADARAVLPDGGVPYFLGIIDDTGPFSTVDITTIGGGFFLYNVDDIATARTTVTAVPEPPTLLLLAIGLITLFAGRVRAK